MQQHDHALAPASNANHEDGRFQDIDPLVLAELRGGVLLTVGRIRGVVVQAQPMHGELAAHVTPIPHQHFAPVIVVVIGAAAILPVVAEVARIGLVAAIIQGILLGGHVAATAPVFIIGALKPYAP
jgi:hypothetical protein